MDPCKRAVSQDCEEKEESAKKKSRIEDVRLNPIHKDEEVRETVGRKS